MKQNIPLSTILKAVQKIVICYSVSLGLKILIKIVMFEFSDVRLQHFVYYHKD